MDAAGLSLLSSIVGVGRAGREHSSSLDIANNLMHWITQMFWIPDGGPKMESEAGQKTFCVLQGDGYGTKIDFISLILFFLYFFSYLTLYNWFFFPISYKNNEELWSLDKEEY